MWSIIQSPHRLVVSGRGPPLVDRRILVRPQRLVGVGDRHAHHHHRAPSSPRLWPGGLGPDRLGGLLRLDLVGGLSSRRPLKAAWRTLPARVQPANSISATKSGRAQCMLLPWGGWRRRQRGWSCSRPPAAAAPTRRTSPRRTRCPRGRHRPASCRDGRRPAASATGRPRWSSRRSPPRGRRGTCLGPVHAAAGCVRRIEAFGDNALEMHPTADCSTHHPPSRSDRR